MTRALVLGGGGVAGIAWQTGLLHGLSESGVDVLGADRFVGTSAGSTVAAQITSGTALAELFRRQVDPALQSPEIPADVDAETIAEMFGAAVSGATDAKDARRRIGDLALAARTVPEADRLKVIEARLPVHDWPAAALHIVAVDAATGDDRVFTAESGVSLVDAVAASCAVPGTWPPVTIGGRRYIDGGVRSMENADLAAGCDRVLVLRVTEVPGNTDLDEQVAALRRDGAAVLVLAPDAPAAEAIGPNLLDPSVRDAAARAGYDQAVRVAAEVTAVWG
ncbi:MULTISPECIES: patatin-like phospholipase family protein [Amycolatopsis]|uniref:Patatin-like phospholipase family protein n=1 Tax=Amycolatopsis tucumanensis TaxID=401106 RepID=A0ABP7HQ16_9PSEU|nr:patatin-like phospholipase family protein [Amycolatopsis tucumanensis]MCF6421023.1 patatin-like phospholipase family protein [Amycolatopsis tucumanensis]